MNLRDYGYKYFTEKPYMDRDGKPIKVGRFTFLDMASFQRYMFIHFLLPLKELKLLNTILCQYFQKMYLDNNRKIQIAMRLVNLYRPYLFFSGVFDDMNMEELQMAAMQGSVWSLRALENQLETRLESIKLRKMQCGEKDKEVETNYLIGLPHQCCP
ncbi:hypothetical protein L6164_026502 [Bauhinia variegata]|uniref:Uncharacterized protein n=1 Tax=Bauhinia variegata TaxID=167791 RepID=A0ACB9LQR9_BAUVA|nr:hypothetical protein L6164_026502 [Bauhinia variegata]